MKTEGSCRLGLLRRRVAKAIKTATLVATAVIACGYCRAVAGTPDAATDLSSPGGDRILQAPTVPASAGTSSAHTSWIDWNGDNFFGPCRGDCAVSLFGGQEVTSSALRIAFLKYPPIPPWDWRFGNSFIAAGAFSRRLVTFWDALQIEPEFGIGQRFGGMHAAEFWSALDIRWIQFPWNNYIKTSVALLEGLDVASEIDRNETILNNRRTVNGKSVYTGSHLLNYFGPEATFALPQYPAYELMIRFHHRSGIFGLINGVYEGAQFITAGIRVHF